MAATRTRRSNPPGRRPPQRRRPARRGRRTRGPRMLLGGLVLAGLVVAGITFLPGLIERGIREVTLPLRHDDIIRQQADEKGVDAALIAAVIYSESRFRDQTSHAGARGLMQITPAAAKDVEKLSGGSTFELEDLSDPEINIRYGTFLLAYLLERYEGDQAAALAAYNAGPGNADEWGGADLTVEDIEFPETRAYVEGVLEKQREYRQNYPEELGY